MQYSFPKAKKFGDFRKSECAQAFYDLPPVRSTRAAAFGYGTKYDFTKQHADTPGPNTYHTPSIFDDSKKKGISFGLGREQMQITGGQYVGDKGSPGPGAYDIRNINKTTIAYSFRPRTLIDATYSSKTVPGPGAYRTIDDINTKGKYWLSKFKNSGASIISPARSERFQYEKKRNEPGPGSYDPKTGINKTGSYFVSKFRSTIGPSFGHSIRKTASAATFENTPGPGSYRLPSEFGYYESASAVKHYKSTTSLPKTDSKKSLGDTKKEEGKEK